MIVILKKKENLLFFVIKARSFEICLQNNCIKLKCYITLEKDKDAKKKRNEQQTPPGTPMSSNLLMSNQAGSNSPCDSLYESLSSPKNNNGSNAGGPNNNNNGSNSGGAKKVNVEVIMKSNPFRVEENEKTTRMELIRNTSGDNSMLRFTYFVRPECEAKKFRGYIYLDKK